MKFDFANGRFVDTELSPDRVALIGTDRQLTCGQLRAEVERIAGELRTLKRNPGPVMIYGHKEAGVLTSILACLYARIPYVPVDTIVPANRLARIAEIAATEFVLCPGEARVEGLRNVGVPDLKSYGARGPTPAWTGEDDLAYIIFTSGSTGEPKGVQIRRANVDDLATWVGSADFGFTDDDVIMNQCSFSFDVSFFDVIGALQCGATLVLNSPAALKTPAPYAGVKPTVWSSTPSFLSLALTAPGFTQANFPSLRRFYIAGEAVHASLCQRLWRRFPDAALWNAYGPTEATIITTLVHVTPEMLTTYPSVPIGFVKPGVSMPTSTANGVAEGELAIIGANVSPGYLNRPDLNETRFFTAPDGRRGYLTGDLGYHRDGMIFYQGRIDSQIKLHGYRIELDEIDSFAGSLPEVEAAATIGLKRGGEVKKLVCFLQPRPGVPAEGLVESVKDFLTERLPYYMVPAEFRVIETMPYNTNHKVDRGALNTQLES